MGVGTHVDRHVVDRDSQIRAVVEIEAAQEILVGLAVAAVLGDDQPGTTSSASAGRENGRALTSSPLTFFSLEDATGEPAADAPSAFSAGAALATGAGFWVAVRFDRPPLSARCCRLKRVS
jgi:hypothetical protein